MTSELLERSDLRIAGRRVAIDPHNCFACGELNAHGLQLRLHTSDERCWTELVLPREFEGWEGIAHGGIVCTILDEVMAWALVSSDSWGLTARMAVAFRRPVRVGTRIRAEGWLVDARRRLYDTAARLVDAETGDELASAEATYAAAPEERKRSLKARYGFRTIDDVEVPAATPERARPKGGSELGTAEGHASAHQKAEAARLPNVEGREP